jgi:hypothetical protein
VKGEPSTSPTSLWSHQLSNLSSGSQRFALQSPSAKTGIATRIRPDPLLDHVKAELRRVTPSSGRIERDNARSKFYSLLKLVRKNATPEDDRITTEAFLAVADAISDPQFFWEFAGEIWVKGGANLRLWSNLFERPDFEQIHVRKRIQAWNSSTDWEQYAQSLYNGWTSDRPIIAYRVFRVEKDGSVRRSNEKGSPGYFDHVEGGGMSYSLSRTYAQHFSALFVNEEVIRRYSGIAGADDMAAFAKYLEDNIQTTWRSSHKKQRAYVGKYHISKRDVVSLAFCRSEEEIVAKRARLMHYYPVTFLDWMASTAFFHYLDKNVGERQGYRSILHRMPEQKVLSEVKKLVRRFAEVDKGHISTFFYGGIPDQYSNEVIGIQSILQRLQRRVLDTTPFGTQVITFT